MIWAGRVRDGDGDVTVAQAVRSLVDDGSLDLPAVGAGHTPARWAALAELARRDVSIGRLAEAHVDAHQILREAGVEQAPGSFLGVWASEHPRRQVTGVRRNGRIVLRGSKGFCSGAGLVDAALVSATVSDEALLVVVPVRDLTPARIDASAWAAPALAATGTADVDLDGIELPGDAVVGGAGWYLDRPGFWHGAVGPAACWGGAALGLVDHALAHPPADPHGTAHLGAMVSDAWAISAALDQAGRQADGAPDDGPGAHRRALVVRHLVDERCADIAERFARALGPRPLVADADVVERVAALAIYRRQCHAERDLEALGALASSADAGAARG